MTRHIVLTGFMGAGKSNSATRIASALGRRAVDVDLELERYFEKPIADVFEQDGEAVFREREQSVVLEELAGEQASVIALGGGALGSDAVKSALRDHVCVYLEVEPEMAWRRVRGGARPLAQKRDEFFALYEQRQPIYEDTATAIVPSGYSGNIMSAVPVISQLLERPPGCKMLWGFDRRKGYPVVIEPGILKAEDLWTVEGDFTTVTDENVARLYQWLSGGLSVPPGEQSKTLEQLGQLCVSLAERGVSRDDSIVAVGGGVIGDLAGFAAAVYQRGIPVVQVPTTLLAQVDSAYGGKTAVDLPIAKNYVGAYHQPASVLVDTESLEQLPPEDLASGYAEVIKTGLIAGGRLWERVAAGVNLDEPFDPWIVQHCAKTKLAVVAADERDDGVRQTLNLGHTIGHAIESATDYKLLRHGEAVGIGMLGALALSGKDQLRQQVAELLQAAGLPIEVPGLDVDAVVDRVRFDKKRSGGVVPFVLVKSPGKVTHGHEVAQEDVRSAIEELVAK